jgi:hypothetical protein
MRQDDVRALKEKRVDLVARMRGMVDDAERRGRDMTSSEQAQFNRLERDARRIGIELEGAEEQEHRGPHLGGTIDDDDGGESALLRAFRRAGFAQGEAAEIPFAEFRAATWTGNVNTLNPARRDGVGLGADSRYAWPAFPQTAVDRDVTAIQVLRQSARTLASAANVIRNIDAVTTKPETSSTMELATVDMRQVATISSNIPNIILEQPQFDSVVRGDLRLALNDGLDKLVNDTFAASGFQAPGTDPLLVSIRKAVTTIQAAGYNPSDVLVTPANAEALDTLRATTTASEQYYVFAPAQMAPRQLYGLNVRVSKVIAAPVVVDSDAYGRLYTSPVSLQAFEADAGATNRSNVRMELHAAFGVERQTAAVRIAAA